MSELHPFDKEVIEQFKSMGTKDLFEQINAFQDPDFEAMTAYLLRDDTDPVQLAKLAIFGVELTNKMRKAILRTALRRYKATRVDNHRYNLAEIATNRRTPNWASDRIKRALYGVRWQK